MEEDLPRPKPLMCKVKHELSEYRPTSDGVYLVARCERLCGHRHVKLVRPIYADPGQTVEFAWTDPWYEAEQEALRALAR